MPEGKIITIRLDPESEKKLDDIFKYYSSPKMRLPKPNKSSLIKLAIHCLWVDIKDNI